MTLNVNVFSVHVIFLPLESCYCSTQLQHNTEIKSFSLDYGTSYSGSAENVLINFYDFNKKMVLEY